MNEELLVIGLSGPRGCGKTTAARMLEAEFGFHPMAFADPIRASVWEAFPIWHREHFEPPLKDAVCPQYRVRPRDMLRAFGEHARGLDPSIYLVALKDRIRAAWEAGVTRIVVHDVRFQAESAALLDLNGYVWQGRRVRSVIVHVQRSGMRWSGEHASEVGPGEEVGDLRLQNVGSLETYGVQVRALAGWVDGMATGRWSA